MDQVALALAKKYTDEQIRKSSTGEILIDKTLSKEGYAADAKAVGNAISQITPQDGISPTVAITDIDGGHRVTITDKDGEKTADVMDGKDGKDGKDGYTPIKGVDYFDGEPGNSGVYVGTEPPTDPDVQVWIDPDDDEVMAFLPQTTEAKVGQYLKISEVDADGRVVAVEAVDAHGGGNGSDSSQNTNQGSGLSSTAKSLLISILQNAVYTSDQSAIIAALKTALEESNSSDDGDSGNTGTEDPDNTYYTVLATTTNCTVESSATSIIEGGVYTALITPDDGYTIETVTVTMGGKDVTSTAYSNGSISISKVTGDIVVVATAMETPNDLVYSANWTFGKRQYSATASQENAAWTSSDWVDVTAGQVLTMTLLESTEIDGTTYNWNGANQTSNAVWFLNASGAAVTAEIPNAYMNLNPNDNYPSSQEITIPDGAVKMCICVSSGRIGNDDYSNPVSCENLDGRPVWWSLTLSNGGAE